MHRAYPQTQSFMYLQLQGTFGCVAQSSMQTPMKMAQSLVQIKDASSTSIDASYIAWNRPQLRRLIWQIDFLLVDVTPTPTFRRVVPFNDRMARCIEVRSRVVMWRIVATADMAARAADTQVYPSASDLEAFLAPACTGVDLLDGGTVGTRCHVASLADRLAIMV
jgi:hypothetical protein